MIIIENDLNLNIEILKNLPQNYNTSKLLLLDIETTGFSSDHNQIYLIGCIFFKDNKAKLIQWLCEKVADEYELLFCFSKFLKDFKYVLHYNGSSFDMPFIKKRLNLFQIKSSIENIQEIDLYSMLRPIQKYLNLENLKLKTIEKYFGFIRNDIFDGKDLINIYFDFIKEQSDNLKKILLLHNKEDLLSLYKCQNAFNYINFFSQARKKLIPINELNFQINDSSIEVSIPYSSNIELHIKIPPYKLHINFNNIVLCIPIISDTLNFFFSDYYNYFYLPMENKVIHKSVARFVDKNYKIKASKENCYIKKRGNFIPLYKNHNTNLKTFQYSIKDSYQYVELTDEFLRNKVIISEIFLITLSDL